MNLVAFQSSKMSKCRDLTKLIEEMTLDRFEWIYSLYLFLTVNTWVVLLYVTVNMNAVCCDGHTCCRLHRFSVFLSSWDREQDCTLFLREIIVWVAESVCDDDDDEETQQEVCINSMMMSFICKSHSYLYKLSPVEWLSCYFRDKHHKLQLKISTSVWYEGTDQKCLTPRTTDLHMHDNALSH